MVTALAVTIVVTTVAGLVWVPRLRVRDAGPTGRLRHPGLWLAVVVAAMFVNQVLVTAYIDRRWGGDPTPIARFVPPGWFDLADLGSAVRVLPAWPWTVLHVQAALELPFVMLAYLLVCRWFGGDAFGRIVAARWLIAASFTATFCIVEWDLRNPFTTVDIVIRLVSGVVTPLVIPLLAPGDGRSSGPVVFAASAASLGSVVLAVYDTATLYNLAHVGGWVPVIATAAVVLVIARRYARSEVILLPVTAAAMRSLGWFIVVFAVPALPVRYGMNFGVAPMSIAAGSALIVGSLWRGWDPKLVSQLAVVAAAGIAGAVVGGLVTSGYPEARLLAAAAGFVLGGAAACIVADRRDERRRVHGR